ncbi:YcnI family protein [Labedaea rhizosphaerae]|uniref:Uncharacterized protein YcnI n=1 Tax=Labedaea rhizosphaerae TaxID=598644 RepID=A0A4V3D0B6_LABRH|nr:YcnI family protein [Labedaea rhizosphaerae]TDQ05115.1 uncharacterized protein YcnI [Labedaea rhizosphaerae]
MSTNRFLLRAGAIGLTAGALAVLGSGIASAHVTAKVLGEPATQGGYTKITFRVPNEQETAGTIKLQVTIDPKYALSSVSTKPMPGWTASVTKTKLNPPVQSGNTKVDEAVTGVTWTAAKGTKIAPGQFDEFEISAGRLPANTDQLVLPAKQTYDNGDVVDWNAPPVADGAEEPDHPAPVVTLTAASGGEHADPAATQQAAPAAATPSSSDDTARWLGGAGLVVGALGLGVGIGATVRARKVAQA